MQSMAWVEQATGLLGRATSPARSSSQGAPLGFIAPLSGTRRQVAAENGQVGRSTRNPLHRSDLNFRKDGSPDVPR